MPYTNERMRALKDAVLTNVGVISASLDEPRCINQRGIVFYLSKQPPLILGVQLGAGVSHLSFIEFDELDREVRPFLQNVGIRGEVLPC